jgi:hypothetical protein
MILRRFFDGHNEGFYIDVGAHHPIRFSNTTSSMGWGGAALPSNQIRMLR